MRVNKTHNKPAHQDTSPRLQTLYGKGTPVFCLEVYVNNKKVAVVGRNNAKNYHATITYWGGHDSVEVSANGASPVWDFQQ